MIYGYARVSTAKQAKEGNSLKYQVDALKKAGAKKIYSDVKTGKNLMRPSFTKMLSEIKAGDTLLVTKLDRFARSISQANEVLTKLIEQNVTVEILNIGKLNNTPTGKLIRNIFLSFAEFERDIIRERMLEGKTIAKQNPNFKEGRPKKYTDSQIDHAIDLLKTYSYTQVERLTGISKSTLIRAKRLFKKNDN